jgi:hypothetical protein
LVATIGQNINVAGDKVKSFTTADQRRERLKGVRWLPHTDLVALVRDFICSTRLVCQNHLHHANSFSTAFASFRSRVSKPSVNHPYAGQQFARLP